MKVTFLHPDLGIGEAIRLVVDAAINLPRHGHQVKVITNRYNRNDCHHETGSLDVSSVFSWIPHSICGDVYFIDQVSACIPIRVYLWFSTERVLFYCHCPDQLLTKLNRFERKKNVNLALEAYFLLKSRLSAMEYSKTFLVIAGGYDKINIEHSVNHCVQTGLRIQAFTLER
ncbi:hypothetical protein QR680_000119 [Steinernema hermaphroditum]|uniref:Glycosyltransferase subfamily 4-like N-terminal domain-containing protein n=1 Tax=Steinernema hermaphroditum TaxID=289476 RepID=A0AA39GU77_9BILA|nr:hypothetical protein QR680_000119 [Steinernema hermaphroditum]